MTRPDPVPNPDPAPDPGPDPVLDAGGAGTSLLPAATRRAFIAGAGAVTVAGAAAVAAGPIVGAGAAAGSVAAAPVTTSGGDAPVASGPAVVAYVRDLVTGEVRLMSGEREVVVRDRALARTLASHVDAHIDSKEG
jgi:hypothetical protein